jgi:hypothetical protein
VQVQERETSWESAVGEALFWGNPSAKTLRDTCVFRQKVPRVGQREESGKEATAPMQIKVLRLYGRDATE